MDKMIRRAARIKWRDILDMACALMTETELATLNSTFGQNDQTFDEWVDAKTEPGAIKWLIDLSDGDGMYMCLISVFRLLTVSVCIFARSYWPWQLIYPFFLNSRSIGDQHSGNWDSGSIDYNFVRRLYVRQQPKRSRGPSRGRATIRSS